ncbi:MAG: PAS domain S-box protein [Proteobacteria bacterium]|nr:PAS domain S-box protein [Pseudomonadota bacterium]
MTFEALRDRAVLVASTEEDATFLVDAAGRVTGWSAGAEDMLGVAEADALGRPAALVVPPNIADVLDAALRDAAAAGRAVSQEAEFPQRRGWSKGISLSVTPIRGMAVSVVALRDVAMARTMAVRLRDAQARLRILENQARTLAGLNGGEQASLTLAHELSQPLSAISNYLRAGMRLLGTPEGPDLGRIGRAVEEALAQSERANETIARLGALMTHGDTDQRVEVLPGLIEEVRAAAQGEAARVGATVTIALGPDTRLVLADRVQLRQALLNLVTNGLQAMEGSSRRELGISARRIGGDVEISVADTGRGVPEAVRDRLFEPFVTTRANGTGLGLMITRAIVEAHGGALAWEDAQGGGTVFRFTVAGVPDMTA